MKSRGRPSCGSGITSPVGTSSPKSPVLSEPKNKFICGNFSPVHTRRRTQSEDVPKVLPDFAEFQISCKCPKISGELGMEVNDVEAELLDLLLVEGELNMFLTHCIDQQKRLCGEIHFMETGDYRSEDISGRLMPSYELRNIDDVPPSTSAEVEEEPVTNIADIVEEDEYDSACPTINMPGKFWKFVKDFEGPIDEEFLFRFYTQFLLPSCSEETAKLFDDASSEGRFRDEKVVPNVTTEKRSVTSPSNRKLLKRQVSSEKRLGRPSKVARTVDNIDSLLAETLQAWSTEEKLNSKRFRTCTSEVSNNNDESFEAMLNGCNGVANEAGEDVDRKNCSSYEDKFDKSYLGIEYKNLKDTVIDVINASENGDAEEVEKKSLKKETKEANKASNGTNGFRVVAHFEAFKKKLMTFVKGAIDDNLALEPKLEDSSEDVEFNLLTTNGKCSNLCKAEKLEVGEEERDESVEIGEELDQVSAALKKALEDLQEKNETCRCIATAVWHRLLAEYLRSKLEADLREATKELNAVREKHFRDFPPKRPSNDRERGDCAAALKKYDKVLKAYYEF